MGSAADQPTAPFPVPQFLTIDTFVDGPPHALFDRLRIEQPVFPSPGAEGERVWSLTRYADVRFVSSNPTLFTSTWRPAYTGHPRAKNVRPDNIMYTDPPKHDRLRYFFLLAFGPRVVRNFEPWIRELALDIIAEVKGRDSTFDFISDVAAELPAMVIAAILGMPRDDRKKMVRWANDLFASTEGSAEGAVRARDAFKEVQEYAFALREKKRHAPGDDMVSMLIDAEHQGAKMTDQEYLMFALTTMAAGYETTHSAIAQSMHFLMNNPDAYLRFHGLGDAGANEALVELLRYVTPAMQMARVANQDVEVGGAKIPAGEEIVMWFSAANRDPAVFENPHAVDFSRRNSAHATFGAGGPHFCVGNQLARLELQILFEEFRRHNIRFVPDGKPDRIKSMLINGFRHLPVRVAR